jgi:hypothetical protein
MVRFLPPFEHRCRYDVSYWSLKFHMYLRLLIAFISAAVVGAPIRAQEKNQPTVDQLVAKNIEAKGGASALQNLQTLRLAGKMLVQQGQIQLAYLQIKKRPDEVRSEASLQGMTQIEAYNGKDWRTKGNTVEYLGTEDVDGTPAHKLKVTRKNGDVSLVYLDPDHFLEIRVLTQRTRHGAYEEIETDLGDYEKAGGVFVPTSIEFGRKGAPDKQRIIIDKVEANVPVDDTIFNFPVSK